MTVQEVLKFIIFPLIISFLGAWLFFRYQKYRQKSIESKAEGIEQEKAFLDRINKGNVELIRTGFGIFSFAFFLVFVSGGALLASMRFDLHDSLINSLFSIAGAMWIAAGIICFSFFRSIVRLKDLKSAKKELDKRKEKLLEKL